MKYSTGIWGSDSVSFPLALITGSCGLIGSEVCVYFHRLGFRTAGIDNNQRAFFLGPEGDTTWVRRRLRAELDRYSHYSIDIRDRQPILELVFQLKPAVIIHTAAQPSHDRAASIPFDAGSLMMRISLMVYRKASLLINRSTLCSVLQKLLPICWFRNTAGISECRPVACAAGA